MAITSFFQLLNTRNKFFLEFNGRGFVGILAGNRVKFWNQIDSGLGS